MCVSKHRTDAFLFCKTFKHYLHILSSDQSPIFIEMHSKHSHIGSLFLNGRDLKCASDLTRICETIPSTQKNPHDSTKTLSKWQIASSKVRQYGNATQNIFFIPPQVHLHVNITLHDITQTIRIGPKFMFVK